MRALAKISYVLGVLAAAVALTASAADARSVHTPRFGGAYDRAYDSVVAPRASTPFGAGVPAYLPGDGGQNSPSDVQLQGR